MKTTSFLLISTLIVSQSFSSCKKAETDDVNKQVSFTKSQIALLKNSNKAGFNLLKEISKGFPAEKNLFISPLSISMALTMAYNGAEGQTALEMQNTLGFEGMSKEDINQSYKDLMQIILNIDPGVAMEIANSIWYKNTFPVKSSFLEINSTYFNAEVKPAEFNSETVNQINAWVKTKTHDKIDKIINSFEPLEVMDIINAIYFKGSWKYKFDTKNTQKDPFRLSNGTTTPVDFMAMKNTFRYMKNDLLSAVELPYGSGGINMLVLLPNEGKTANDLVQALSPENWEKWTGQLDSAQIYLQLPKFKFAYDESLKDPLINLGMTSAFLAEKADFSNISDQDLYVSDVIHKTFVDVNEEGTEAAAVTVVRFVTTSIGEPTFIPFFANKPFLFAIRENTTNSIIFIGQVNKPVIE